MLATSKVVTPAQCRAGRAFLGWTQTMLAERVGVGRRTIADFETGSRHLSLRTRRDVTAALEGAGLQFTHDGNDGLAVAAAAVSEAPRAAG